MIANAVPPPVAQRIGEVILARDRGETVLAIEGRFVDWLVRRGRNRTSARNVKSSLARARRLLGGRSFADPEAGIATLETSLEFTGLPKATRSDLRQALRLYCEFQCAKTKRQRAAECREAVADPELKEAA